MNINIWKNADMGKHYLLFNEPVFPRWRHNFINKINVQVVWFKETYDNPVEHKNEIVLVKLVQTVQYHQQIVLTLSRVRYMYSCDSVHLLYLLKCNLKLGSFVHKSRFEKLQLCCVINIPMPANWICYFLYMQEISRGEKVKISQRFIILNYGIMWAYSYSHF